MLREEEFWAGAGDAREDEEDVEAGGKVAFLGEEAQRDVGEGGCGGRVGDARGEGGEELREADLGAVACRVERHAARGHEEHGRRTGDRAREARGRQQRLGAHVRGEHEARVVLAGRAGAGDDDSKSEKSSLSPSTCGIRDFFLFLVAM